MYLKWLRAGSVSPVTGFSWRGHRGVWLDAHESDPCRKGFHACTLADLPYWISDELWLVDLDGDLRRGTHKTVATQIRLTGRVTTWTTEVGREMAQDCLARTAFHAAEELRVAGRGEAADRLLSAPASELGRTARNIMASLSLASGAQRDANDLCGYVVDAAEGVDIYPVATVAYIAARAANRRTTPYNRDYLAEERAGQVDLLVERLGLDASMVASA